MKALASVCAFALTVFVGGCSSDPKTTTPLGSDAARHYALLADPAWTLHEAIDLRADDPLAATEHPALDWYDEYERSPSATESQTVRVSGHDATFEASQREFEGRGYELSDVTIAGWQAVSAFLPGDTPHSLLVLDNGDSSLLVLSYELSLADLSALAEKIRPANAATWIAAGGVIR